MSLCAVFFVLKESSLCTFIPRPVLYFVLCYIYLRVLLFCLIGSKETFVYIVLLYIPLATTVRTVQWVLYVECIAIAILYSTYITQFSQILYILKYYNIKYHEYL